MNITKSRIFGLLTAALLVSGYASATVLEDVFKIDSTPYTAAGAVFIDTTAGTGLNGGTGFAGGWSRVAGGDPGRLQTVATGLDYTINGGATSLPNSGGALTFVLRASAPGGNDSVGALNYTRQLFAAPLPDGETVYIAYLLNMTTSTGFRLGFGATADAASGTGPPLGLTVTAGAFMANGGGAPTVTVLDAIGDSKSHLYVWKIAKLNQADQTVEVWVDPTSFDASYFTSTAARYFALTPVTPFTLQYMGSNSAAASTGSLDALRIAYGAGATITDALGIAAAPGGTAPTITTQPAALTKNVGESATFTVVAAGTAPLTYQWKKDGANVAAGTAATLTLANAQTTDAGSYTVVVTNATGTVTSSAAVLTVNAGGTPPPATAPTISTQPAALTKNVGESATLTVVAAGTAPLTYQWKKGGANVAAGTAATLTLANVQTTDAGSYTVVVTNATGTVTSSAAILTVNAGGTPPPATAPAITAQPSSQSVNTGRTATFTVAASGTAPLSYQWKKNGAVISGATNATLTISGVQSTDADFYTVVVTNSLGSVTSNPATLTVTIGGPEGRVVNISGRGAIGTGENTLAVGFVFGGTASKSVLVRAIGPTLRQFGVSSAVADPAYQLLKNGAAQASNDNWDGSAATSTAFAQSGAFPLTAGSLDAALVSTLTPGTYTANITAAGGSSGSSAIALAEVYETASGLSDSTRFLNFSVRGQVGVGDNVLIVGFIVSGGSKRILVRGIGPALAAYGLTSAIADPRITLYSGAVATPNDNWDGSAATIAAFTQAGAFALTSGSKDAALIADLQPGAYTVVLSGVGSATGVGLLEIYELP